MREKKLILVVDDSRTVLHGTCRMLQKAGYEIIEASCGMDGLRLAIEYKPDLVLLDVVLPYLYGYEVCRRIKAESDLAGTLVILISSLDTHEDHETHGLEIGADGYIARPVSNNNLLAHIKSLLRLKAAEDSLRQSELKFRTVAEFTYDWEYWIAPDGGILYMSPSSERITGYRRDEFVNNPELLIEIIHKDDRRNATDHLNHIDLSDAHIVDFRIITRNGEDRWIAHQCQPIFDDGGKFLGRRVSNCDITDRKRAEDSAWQLASIVESSDDAIISKTWDGTITSWNGGAERLYGYSAKEIIGQPISILLPPEILNDLPEILTRICRGEIVSHFETNRQTKDGRIVDVSLTISPIKTPEGKIIGASSTARDITERKLLEKERQKVFVELQKALSEVKKLSGFLPICSSCKKIRDDKGYWSGVESYISDHSEALFSHSICPDCMRKLYPEYADAVLSRLEKEKK